MNDALTIEAPIQSPAAVNAYIEVQETKQAIRLLQGRLRDLLSKDEQYQKEKLEAGKTAKQLKWRKEELMRAPELRKIEEDIKGLKKNLETEQLTLFTELDRYQETTGTSVLIVDDQKKLIEKSYKLKKL